MSDTASAPAAAASPGGLNGARPAPLVRAFGWANLALLAAFLVNTVLTFRFGLPGSALWSWGGVTPAAWAQTALYPLAVVGAAAWALATRERSLRRDARAISDFNLVLVRIAFWVVFLVGIVDAVVSFLRVEGLLPALFGETLAIELGRSEFRGKWVHLPTALVAVGLALRTRRGSLGFIWLSLLVVVAELLIVFSRFIFSYEQAFMGDLVRFWYAALFLFASAYTLLEDGHVRVDVFYTNFTHRKKGLVNAAGSVLLGMTLCWTILLIGCWSSSSVIVGPLLVFETTQTGFGMYVKYFMAGFLGLYAITMMIQFVAYFFESVADMRGDPGGHEDHHVGHLA